MSQVIYARVPDALKEAADVYASENGTTLTRAVVELLETGLAATSDGPSIEDLQANLVHVTAEKRQTEADLHAARTELAALRALAQRVNRTVGSCPNLGCKAAITGYDLLAAGQCSRCKQTLTGLIAPPTATTTLDQRELMVLLGALGAVVGVALLTSSSGG